MWPGTGPRPRARFPCITRDSTMRALLSNPTQSDPCGLRPGRRRIAGGGQSRAMCMSSGMRRCRVKKANRTGASGWRSPQMTARILKPERIAFDNPVGACGCCGLKAYADAAGNVYVMFRSADQVVNRDIWLLSSTDHGRTFSGSNISHWNIGACVMSSESFATAPNGSSGGVGVGEADLLRCWCSRAPAGFPRRLPRPGVPAQPQVSGACEQRPRGDAVRVDRGHGLEKGRRRRLADIRQRRTALKSGMREG